VSEAGSLVFAVGAAALGLAGKGWMVLEVARL